MRTTEERKTYPYTSVETSRHQMYIIELQACDWSRMSHETTVNLAAPEIPETNHAVGSSAGQGRVKTLKRTDEVGRGVW